MIVMKFGGTSVQDAAAMQRLALIVAGRAADAPVVVVSAMAQVTDTLLNLELHTGRGDHEHAHEALDALVARHAATADALDLDGTTMTAITAEAEALRALLAQTLGRGWSDAERDHVVAHGELWSSRLVTGALRAIGADAVWVDARYVVRTDDRFGRAVPDLDIITVQADQLLRPLVEAGHVPVTQGFIGAGPDARTTTLGRGGSDYTGALLGAALGVRVVEIWTDVNGIMTADPRLVPNAQTLDIATYDEAAELATFGAKVLHPATALPLVERGIPIVVRNSFQPEHPGTRIMDAPSRDDIGVRSISSKRGITIVNVRMPRMLGAYGVLREIFEVFERHEVPVDVLASSEVSVSVTIDDSAASPTLQADLARLGEVSVLSGRAIIAIVGHGLWRTAGIPAQAFQAVRDVHIELISQGASSSNMTFVIDQSDVPGVVRRLHDAFFGTPA